jgi:hypothetical protein
MKCGAHRIAADRLRPAQGAHRLPLRLALLRPRLSGLGPIPNAHDRDDAAAKYGADFARTLDSTHYTVRPAGRPAPLAETGRINICSAAKGSRIELTAWFSPKADRGRADTVAAVRPPRAITGATTG